MGNKDTCTGEDNFLLCFAGFPLQDLVTIGYIGDMDAEDPVDIREVIDCNGC